MHKSRSSAVAHARPKPTLVDAGTRRTLHRCSAFIADTIANPAIPAVIALDAAARIRPA